jgi:multidrug efflux pump subunit AcrB
METPTIPSASDTSAKRTSWLVRVSVFNPYLVIVLCLFIVVIGYVCLSRIPVDILPSFKTPAVQVLTLYPGMPTEIMDRDITNRIERWTSQAEGIARQESRTMIGVSVVRDYAREDVDPNAFFSQVTSLATSDLYYLPPGTVPPMAMLFDPTAPLPTALLAASSEVLDEKQSYDLAYFNVRNMLSGSPGVIAPAVFGGKLRRIYVYLDPVKLQARGLSLTDVLDAIKRNNIMIPTGSVKIGDTDYMVNMENMVEKFEDLNDIVVKMDKGNPIYVKDVGTVKDTSAIQTNVVRISRGPRWESKRQVYIPIFRRPGSNTIEVVDGVKQRIPEFLDRLPRREGAADSGLQLDVVADQSVFVRSAIRSLTWEGILGAVLASGMVLVFIGSVRSTVIIALTIPLSALVAIIGLYFTGNTLNAMTLGGLALVMGRLVDDPIVDIENTFRHLDMGKTAKQAALDSAMEIAMPVLVATITTVAVFFPVVFLYGMGKYLFAPLALCVAFAMFASYVLSRTLSPAYCAYFLQPHAAGRKRFPLFRVCDAGYERLKGLYTHSLSWALAWRWPVVAVALALLLASFGLYPLLGRELFPVTDGDQIVINVRAASGKRIEKTEELNRHIEEVIKRTIPEADRKMIVTDIGVLYDWPAGYTANAAAMDATLLIQLSEAQQRRTSSQDYAQRLRTLFQREFPGVEFAFNTGGMVSAALSFGLPAPINIKIEGSNLQKQERVARELKRLLETEVPGAVDLRIQQPLDYPTIRLLPNRQKMAFHGITVEDVVKNLLSVLSSSTNFDPIFWLDYRTGNHYFVGVTMREQDIKSLDTLKNIPITGKHSSAAILLQTVVDFKMDTSSVEVSHLALSRAVDLYANVQGRDVGSVAADIERVLTRWGQRKAAGGAESAWTPADPDQPGQPLSGFTVRMRGEVSSMRQSFQDLGFGFILAAVLIYLIMVAQFRSFLDPFIVMFAVPLGLIGVLVMLSVTDTTLNVQSAMGVIFMVGIAVSNSVLLVEFANRLRVERGMAVREAAQEAASVRLRPILMTSLAAVVGLLPLALREGEATMPLARAVIGGLSVSTLLTIFVVPCLYVIFKGRGGRHNVAAAPVSA